MSNILWLASYPKSGNTWLRTFFANFLSASDAPVDINSLRNDLLGNRHEFDFALGLESSDLTPLEIDDLRQSVYRWLALNNTSSLLVEKIHDSFPYAPDRSPSLPTAISKIIYVIRNPLDIVPSAAAFFGFTIEETIQRFSNPNWTMTKFGYHLFSHLPQHVGKWDSHVCSWVDQPFIPVLVLRYEDMWLKPTETFTNAARFAGFPNSPDRVAQAIRFSSFDELQRQEKQAGFQSRPAFTKVFFRKGKIGAWREELTSDQVTRIIADHGAVMRRFGYLDQSSQPA